MRLISGQLAAPVLRACSEDRLCLNIIAWMHNVHLATANIPAAYGDGGVAVWPFLKFDPIISIYFFPSLEQCGLLYQPLNFHELGHVLYLLHKPEMDDLVRDLQQKV